MYKSKYLVSFIFLFNSFLSAASVAERYGDRIELLGIPFKDPLVLCQILIAMFLSIVFLQSGIDKIIDREGNEDYFKSQFSNSILNKITSFLLSILTVLELTGGVMLIYGIYFSFVERTTLWIFYGLVVLSITTILLMAGQRIAKDYLGAANLVPYFILIMLGIMSMY